MNRQPILLIALVVLAATATILVASHGTDSVLGMQPDDFARLAYLGTLLMVVASGFLFQARGGGGGGRLRAALIWGGLAGALVIGYELFGPR